MGDYNFSWEIGHTVIGLHSLMEHNYLEDYNTTKPPYYASVLTKTLIDLNYILQESSKHHTKISISFKDDIVEYKGERDDSYHDIKGLIRFFRNAACHANAISLRQTFDKKQKIAFAYQTGKIGDPDSPIKHLCNYDDDIAILMGDHVLYVNRHIKRAFGEISDKLFASPRFFPYKKLLDFRPDSLS